MEASEATATRFVTALEASLDRLTAFPSSGAQRPQLAPDLRVAVHSPYVVYYLPKEDEVLVVRVLHGARDAAAIASAGGLQG